MSIVVSAYGFVGQDVVSIGEEPEHLMVSSSIVCNADMEGGGPKKQWFTIVGFGEVAEAMKNLKIGDPISVTGKLYANCRHSKTGVVREGLEIVVDQMLSARAIDVEEKNQGASRKENLMSLGKALP